MTSEGGYRRERDIPAGGSSRQVSSMGGGQTQAEVRGSAKAHLGGAWLLRGQGELEEIVPGAFIGAICHFQGPALGLSKEITGLSGRLDRELLPETSKSRRMLLALLGFLTELLAVWATVYQGQIISEGADTAPLCFKSHNITIYPKVF